MTPFLAVILVGVPLAWLVGFAAYAYLDAPEHGMDPRKWALIAFFVPLFGFFAYIFERGERDYDPEKRLGPAGTEADDGDDEDEWNDPDGVDL
jgi:hypothetical protein